MHGYWLGLEMYKAVARILATCTKLNRSCGRNFSQVKAVSVAEIPLTWCMLNSYRNVCPFAPSKNRTGGRNFSHLHLGVY